TGGFLITHQDGAEQARHSRQIRKRVLSGKRLHLPGERVEAHHHRPHRRSSAFIGGFKVRSPSGAAGRAARSSRSHAETPAIQITSTPTHAAAPCRTALSRSGGLPGSVSTPASPAAF